VFAWSFYNQGTRDQSAVSSEPFLAAAINFFGNAKDKEFAASSVGARDKGIRLAHIVGARRSLLILDGLEPLQYAPTSPTPGEFKDAGLAMLLKGLAASSRGLCVVTTRCTLSGLKAYLGKTVEEKTLPRLSTAAGVELLQRAGVIGSLKKEIRVEVNGCEILLNEFEQLVEDVGGHALTLQILGGFLTRAHQGDIRRRDRIDLQKADAKIQGGHAFRAIAAYVKWLEQDSDESRRELALLSLLGLFDRPATADCLEALRRGPAIPALTEPLVGLAEEDWELTLSALRDSTLLTVNRDESTGELISLDAHPLLREYFGTRVRENQPEACRMAHRRLYEHLCASAREGETPTITDLQPLYQAIGHGCQAGLHQEVCEKVYFDRILKHDQHYSWKKLAAFGSDLAALTFFFETQWSRVSDALKGYDQAILLNQASIYLRALGRVVEAIEPARAAVAKFVALPKPDWENAAQVANNLAELELILGKIDRAVHDGELSVTYADHSGDVFHRVARRTILATALHFAGRVLDAQALFQQAEQIQAKAWPDYPMLYSIQGFRYCDFLLASPERWAWQIWFEELRHSNKRDKNILTSQSLSCRSVSNRALKTLEWAHEKHLPILTIALDRFSIRRAFLYLEIIECADSSDSGAEMDQIVSQLRETNAAHYYLPRALLTRAWQRFRQGMRIGWESAESDLKEAGEIAKDSCMPLHLADVYLYRARLFLGESNYPWLSAQHDIAQARHLIEKHGYWRRKLELEDAEASLKGT
jgi:tetratricopeptide (TPR) repeat protein